MVRKLRIIEVYEYVPYKSSICKGKLSDFNWFATAEVCPRETEIVRLKEVFELSRFELARFNCILKKEGGIKVCP